MTLRPPGHISRDGSWCRAGREIISRRGWELANTCHQKQATEGEGGGYVQTGSFITVTGDTCGWEGTAHPFHPPNCAPEQGGQQGWLNLGNTAAKPPPAVVKIKQRGERRTCRESGIRASSRKKKKTMRSLQCNLPQLNVSSWQRFSVTVGAVLPTRDGALPVNSTALWSNRTACHTSRRVTEECAVSQPPDTAFSNTYLLGHQRKLLMKPVTAPRADRSLKLGEPQRTAAMGKPGAGRENSASIAQDDTTQAELLRGGRPHWA
ncbi:hypothetical protein SKAU_G00214710 [Synaphobranchus kaupii]|uniref:Uncharacterized protein n=1 Tax=Synaphobranchus kaupii TaxID=118154 RepID=A0A9Q1F9G8_SYNKA|nr:hypothetical protein SKAU_G00214710 [Synaphobranchus kaupii]